MAPAQPIHRVLASERRAALVAVLEGAGRPLSAAEAGAAIGLGPSTTRHHLELLASAGLAERAAERRSTAGRPTILYSIPGPEVTPAAPATPAAEEPDGNDYQRLASVLAFQLSGTADPAGAAREAGRRWIEALDVPRGGEPLEPDEAIAEVLALMGRLGFAPERPAGEDRLELLRCPFEAVAREHRAVVCGVHQGMLEETFARLGGRVDVDGLEPFVRDVPLLCVVALRRAPGTATAATGTSRARDDGRRRRSDRSRPEPERRGTSHG
jgi:predicted ArsR family transcriptional regulator